MRAWAAPGRATATGSGTVCASTIGCGFAYYGGESTAPVPLSGRLQVDCQCQWGYSVTAPARRGPGTEPTQPHWQPQAALRLPVAPGPGCQWHRDWQCATGSDCQPDSECQPNLKCQWRTRHYHWQPSSACASDADSRAESVTVSEWRPGGRTLPGCHWQCQ